jgi:hypothetical protein
VQGKEKLKVDMYLAKFLPPKKVTCDSDFDYSSDEGGCCVVVSAEDGDDVPPTSKEVKAMYDHAENLDLYRKLRGKRLKLRTEDLRRALLHGSTLCWRQEG